MIPSSVALVTGCSTGIGRGTALHLARRGVRVFAGVRRPHQLRELALAAEGLPLHPLLLDVDEPRSVARAFKVLRAKAGRLDLLINNAGYGAFGALEDFTDEEARSQYETNVLGLHRVTREALPLLRASGRGRVLHIGSLAGRMTFSGIGLYCSSKHAVEALTEALRWEARPFGVEVAVVEPGSMNTAFKANRRRNEAFQKGRSAYQGTLQRILDFGNRRSGEAPGADRVVRTIEKALRDKTLKIRYPVGQDAVLYPLVRWCLGGPLWDLLMDRVSRKFQPAPRRPAPFEGEKVALVTGATSGFGLETVRLLARAGWRTYGTYRDPRKTGSLRALAGKVFPLFMDLDRPKTVAAAVKLLFKKEGRLDLLVNNAGFVMAGFLEDLSAEELAAQLETNVFGLLRVTRACLPLFRRQGGGRIVNLGSISGRVAFPGLGAYAASKFAVRSLSEALRREGAPFGVQVSEVAPGSYGTRIVASTRYGAKVKSKGSPYTAFTARMEGLVKKESAKGGDPAEVARLVLRVAAQRRPRAVYLAGPDAKFMNFLKWALPDAWFEGALGLVFPWSRPPAGRSGP